MTTIEGLLRMSDANHQGIGRFLRTLLHVGITLALVCLASPVVAQELKAAPKPAREVPHGQDRLPNEPLSPAEAIRKMTVPKGFTVELVAAEPDIVNPVAMTFDERGRVWITESLEYPRRSSGPGRDRVKVLEDTDGDGKADKFTVFAEGLNIPSGVAVGHGGVWVANSPDLLFLQDTDGDGKADRREVVVSGFGRDDTHELPNTLAWGPDGWLYGWNGVFNPSHIVHRNKTYDFTCAIFRIHPKTREFEIFCEGTSNPWGIAWNDEGSAFASACVIDHLWHLTETGYYHRQGGPYPPFTWKIESIVDYGHQKAAYCGIHYYESDAYPPEYRGKLYMGNIHGNCVNVDSLRRRGSTYSGAAKPDFLSANDAWFMPVAQKTGPDGSIYVLDWYDRYHCYQDANRDPGGIDRLKGRLYRVRYQGTPRRSGFDLSKQSDDELALLLASPNGFNRDTARRLLTERSSPRSAGLLRGLALDKETPRRTRMNAIWTLAGSDFSDPEFWLALLNDPDPGIRSWGVRAVGNARKAGPAVSRKLRSLAADESGVVQLQVAIAARKVEGLDALAILTEVASLCQSDPLIPRIVWQNLHPLLADRATAARFVELVAATKPRNARGLYTLVPHAVDRLVSHPEAGSIRIIDLVDFLIEGDSGATRHAVDSLARIAAKVQSGELSKTNSAALRKQFAPRLNRLVADPGRGNLHRAAVILAASWREASSFPAARATFAARGLDAETRLSALNALIVAQDRDVLDSVALVLTDRQEETSFRGQVISALGRLNDPKVADLILDRYPELEPDLKPRVVELLSQRGAWGIALLKSIGRGVVPPSAVDVNQIRKLLAGNNPELLRLVKERWGTIRQGRNEAREQVIGNVREMLRKTPGDAQAGTKIFQRLCAQCHKIYGAGQDVGPEITLNGRSSYEQLLSNVFDPSLVIGTAYQGTTVATTDGRVLTGLIAEKSATRVVLKLQGGKLEIIPSGQVEELKVSPLSLMPEDVEKQLQPGEIADLFAYLTLDRPPGDPAAKRLPGAEELPTSPKAP